MRMYFNYLWKKYLFAALFLKVSFCYTLITSHKKYLFAALFLKVLSTKEVRNLPSAFVRITSFANISIK